jgi:DNA polymerase alpha subunit B
MADVAEADLNDRFASGGKELEPDVVTILQSIMRTYHLSLQDLFFKWESYCIKMDAEEMRPTVEKLRAFKEDLLDALEKAQRSQVQIKQEKRSAATPRAVVKSGDVFGM